MQYFECHLVHYSYIYTFDLNRRHFIFLLFTTLHNQMKSYFINSYLHMLPAFSNALLAFSLDNQND